MAFNQKAYIGGYNKNTYKMFPFRVRKDNIEVLKRLDKVNNKNKYILDLIENDISLSVLTLKQIKSAIMPIMHKHGIYDVYLFGSYARGEANRDSDVDIYCESGDIQTLIDQGFFEDELSAALGKDVDVVFIGSEMDDYFRKQMEGDLIKLC